MLINGIAGTLAAIACLAAPWNLSAGWTHRELRRFPAQEANQGVAVDERFAYVISNREIGKYDKQTGTRRGVWKEAADGRIVHLNSGFVRSNRLYCAHSNFPKTPMASSIEIFDTGSMKLVETKDLGKTDGSLTWAVWRNGHWYACFAHYAASKPVTGRDPSATQVVRLNDRWERVTSWSLPTDLTQRFGNYSSSGGAFGPYDKLFITGHDARELYVLDLPGSTAVLHWSATIPISAEGQAFGWDPVENNLLYSINRRTREVIVSRVEITGEP